MSANTWSSCSIPKENRSTPTTSAKARELLQGGVAEERPVELGTFGIRILVATRRDAPRRLGRRSREPSSGLSIVVDRETPSTSSSTCQTRRRSSRNRGAPLRRCTSVPQVPSPAVSVGRTGAERTSWPRARRSSWTSG